MRAQHKMNFEIESDTLSLSQLVRKMKKRLWKIGGREGKLYTGVAVNVWEEGNEIWYI